MKESLLNSEVQELTEDAEALSNEQFAALTAEIEQLRSAIQRGEQVPLDEARKIVVWFRARRRKNFTVIKEKAVKAKTPAAPRKKKSASEQQALAEAILNAL
jgi:hypothetical protein